MNAYQFKVKLAAAHYFRLTRASTLKTAVNGAWFQSPSIFRNELFQIEVIVYYVVLMKKAYLPPVMQWARLNTVICWARIPFCLPLPTWAGQKYLALGKQEQYLFGTWARNGI